jgi:hypothetical protein
MTDEVRKYLAGIGRKGGQAATGKDKKRGGAAHYRELAERSQVARRRNKAQRARHRKTAERHQADAAAAGWAWVCACVACAAIRAWDAAHPPKAAELVEEDAKTPRRRVKKKD